MIAVSPGPFNYIYFSTSKTVFVSSPSSRPTIDIAQATFPADILAVSEKRHCFVLQAKPNLEITKKNAVVLSPPKNTMPLGVPNHT